MPVRKNPLHLSSLHDPTMKQGIVSILCSDCEKTKTTSIRRTLSADMSSKKWLQQNGFKSSSFSLRGEYERGKMQKSDIWNSIFTQKSEISSYVHPLVKGSSSCLSEKSLEFCTESLGSETGSDGFLSESADEEENKEVNPPAPAVRKSPVRSFPPPISFIARGDGLSLKMQSDRENGRLVLEAVSVPPRRNFHAQRRDGRLVLTFISSSNEFEEEMASADVGSPEEKFEGGNVAKEEGFQMGSGNMMSVNKSGVAVAGLVPPPPPATALFKYSCRSKTDVYGGFINMRGKEKEDLVPYLGGCNGPERSPLIGEPYCIATS